jgi:formylglycine-generating enzyme required for sulfatase activity
MAEKHVSINSSNPPSWRYEDNGPILSAGLNDFFADEFAVSAYDWIQVASWAKQNGYADLPDFPELSSCGYNLPVTMVSYLDVLKWCNARSEKEGKKPVYWLVQDSEVLRVGSNFPIEWNILDDYTYSRDGYRLPHDNEWIYIANDLNGNSAFLNAFPGINNESLFGGSRVQYNDNSDYSYSTCSSLASNIFVGGSLTINNSLLKGPRSVYDFTPSAAGFYGLCGNVSEFVYRLSAGNCLPYQYARAFGGNFLNSRRELRMDGSVSSFLSRSCILSPNWVNYSICGYPSTFRIYEKRHYVGFRTFRTDLSISYTPFSPVYVEEPASLKNSVLPMKPTRIEDGEIFSVGVLGSVVAGQTSQNKFTRMESSFAKDYLLGAAVVDHDEYGGEPPSGYLSNFEFIFPNDAGYNRNFYLKDAQSYLSGDEGVYINSISAGLSSTLVVSGKDNNPSGFRVGVFVSGYDSGYHSLVVSANASAITGALEVFSSNDHAFVLLNNGKVTGWGLNDYGQITDLLNDSSGYFTGNWNSSLVGSLTGVKKIGCSYFQTIFLFQNGFVSGIGYSGINGGLDLQLANIGEARDIFVKDDICFVSYKDGNEGDYLLTGIGLYGRPETGVIDFVGGLKNVIDLDSSSRHIVVLFDDFTISGYYFGDERSYCGEVDFDKVNYPVYGVYTAMGATLLKRDLGAFRPTKGDFLFSFSSYGDPATGLDFPISNMSIEASIPKNIIDHEDGRLSWFYSPQNYNLTFPSGEYYDASRVYMSVSGASLADQFYTNSGGQYEYLRNPAIEIYRLDDSGNIGAAFEGNEFWKDLSTGDIAALSSSNFINTGTFSIYDPALLIEHSLSAENKYQITLIEKNSSQYKNWSDFYMREGFPSRYRFNLKFDPIQRSVSRKITNDVDASFIEYNVSGNGAYSRNVIGYNIEFLESTYSPPELINEDISNLIYTPLVDEVPEAYNGLQDYKNTITSFCIQGLDCEEDQPGEPASTCWSGRDITGQDYQRFFENFIKSLNSGARADTSDAKESDKFLKVATHDVFFYSWTGFILFNDFIKGDLVGFDPYNFASGYYSYYRQLYLQDPPYANLEKFSLKFKEDFEDPTGLVESLNSAFSDYSYQKVWYPYDCPTGLGKEGVFVDVGDALAVAEIIDPAEFYGASPPNSFVYTGSGELESEQEKWDRYLLKHSGRVIKITSNHFHESGHNLSLRLGNVRSSVETKIQRGEAYLLPSYFELHGSMDGSGWDIIDIVSNFEWSGIEAKAGSEPQNLELAEPEEPIDLEEWLEDQLDIKYPGTREDIMNYTMTSIKEKKPWCGGNTIEKTDGSLFWFAGVPVNYPVNLCKIEDGGGGEDEEEGEGDEEGGEADDKAASYYKSMGSLLKPELLSVPDHYYLRYVNYNFYKIKFKNFANEATGFFMNPLDEFKVKRISFYSTVDVPPIELEGPEECVIGSDYSIDISGYVPVMVTGYFTGTIDELDSGFVNAFNVWVEGEPSGLVSGDWVRFNRESGRLVSNYASGPIRTGFYLTGEFNTGKADWYYNPSTKEITLFRNLSTTIGEQSSGSGFFGGEYIRLREEVVNRELAAGGFIQPGFSYTGITGVYFTDDLIGFKNETNLTGCFEKEFLITGESLSGFFSYNETVTGVASGETLIYGEPTGFVTATGVINYLSPSIGDYIVLNEEKISFNPDGVNFTQPYYFDSFSTLTDTFTGQDYSYLFDSSFEVDDINNKIYVYSNLPGESGNSVSFYYYSTGGIFTEPSGFLSGGEDLNQYITALNSSTYSGEIDLSSVAITGFYTVPSSGSGYIYGYVEKLLGVRNFTDVWSLYTGLDPKFENMYLVTGNTGDISVSGNYTGELLGLYPEMLNLNLFYDDVFSTAEATLDVARLGIFDSNYSGSGVYHIITSE